jgi:hypothetical protein
MVLLLVVLLVPQQADLLAGDVVQARGHLQLVLHALHELLLVLLRVCTHVHGCSWFIPRTPAALWSQSATAARCQPV